MSPITAARPRGQTGAILGAHRPGLALALAERDFRCARMASSGSSAVESGAPVSLKELRPASPLFADGASLRVLGKLQEYSVETTIAVIVDGDASLKIDTRHLRDLSFRIGSIYQFIGELQIQPDNEAMLRARVGRNVDGLDLNLYHQSLQLVRQFQAERTRYQST